MKHKARNQRAIMAEATLAILEDGSYSVQGRSISIQAMQNSAVENSRLYTPDELSRLTSIQALNPRYETKFEVSGETSLDAARRLGESGEDRVFVLNFASARNAGGGFLGGSQAQEESIARASGLYPTLERHQTYYSVNRKERSCLYTDHMIYSPGVPVFRFEDGTLMDSPLPCDVLTAPAPNAGAVKQRNEGQEVIDLIGPTMARRIDQVLAIAVEQGNDVLVLGAWGCGVFQNDPEQVATLFFDALKGKFKGCFRRIVFAIFAKDPRFAGPFERLFNE